MVGEFRTLIRLLPYVPLKEMSLRNMDTVLAFA